ncbi:MAG: hypothetical protein WC564_02725 [Patescibacteria group bacterium]|jgi:hypothetical protein
MKNQDVLHIVLPKGSVSGPKLKEWFSILSKLQIAMFIETSKQVFESLNLKEMEGLDTKTSYIQRLPTIFAANKDSVLFAVYLTDLNIRIIFCLEKDEAFFQFCLLTDGLKNVFNPNVQMELHEKLRKDKIENGTIVTWQEAYEKIKKIASGSLYERLSIPILQVT